MDETAGRATARNFDLKLTGALGILLKAKVGGSIDSYDREMQLLKSEAGIFVSDQIRNHFLSEADETKS